MALGDVIELKFGSELQTLQFIRRTSALLPFGSAEVHLSPNTVAAYRYSSSSPVSRLASEREALPIEPMQVGPRISVNGFAPELQRGAHHEVSLAHRTGKNNMMLAVYRDSLRDPALTGVGAPVADSGQVLADPYSGTFTYQGADGANHTVNLLSTSARNLAINPFTKSLIDATPLPVAGGTS